MGYTHRDWVLNVGVSLTGLGFKTGTLLTVREYRVCDLGDGIYRGNRVLGVREKHFGSTSVF